MGCASLLRPNDGFSEKLSKGCTTLESCEVLYREAEERHNECQRAANYGNSCESVGKDLGAATRLLSRARKTRDDELKAHYAARAPAQEEARHVEAQNLQREEQARRDEEARKRKSATQSSSNGSVEQRRRPSANAST